LSKGLPEELPWKTFDRRAWDAASRVERTTTMTERKTWSTKYNPDIIPTLARRRAAAHSARGLTVGQYLEKLVLQDAGRKHSLGAPVADEAAALARIGSLIAFARAALQSDPAQALEHLATAQRAIFERTSELQEAVALTQRLRSHEAWVEAGAVHFEGYPEKDK
jgi:hypothetical protein